MLGRKVCLTAEVWNWWWYLSHSGGQEGPWLLFLWKTLVISLFFNCAKHHASEWNYALILYAILNCLFLTAWSCRVQFSVWYEGSWNVLSCQSTWLAPRNCHTDTNLLHTTSMLVKFECFPVFGEIAIVKFMLLILDQSGVLKTAWLVPSGNWLKPLVTCYNYLVGVTSYISHLFCFLWGQSPLGRGRRMVSSWI